MFEITPNDIAGLGDEDLRILIGLLCESEVRRKEFSTSAVTWGGNQNARDGGIDVRVALPPDTRIEGFVPRPATGFQVKKCSFTPGDILGEMRPGGLLRTAIRDLAALFGAYIIASSSSTSDTALQDRRSAMREAVNDLSNGSNLLLDFYDSGRLATWVRDHAGLVLWVREKIGRPLSGWRPYGAWAYSPEGKNDQYILDDGLRIRSNGKPVDALEGIESIRNQLRRSGAVVRLIGLSGVGKTRLVQALFDERVGEHSLEPSLAMYADAADNLDPEPAALVSEVNAQRSRAILVVDNCSPEIHRKLSEQCRLPESGVSAITIEYDIREDQPEGTEVFELEPSSIELIEKLLRRRFPHISQIDVRTIAEFSGGNARIAVVLSETVGRQETVSGMSDEDLFKRLFHQRNEVNEDLLHDAEALSLVYSFQAEDLNENENAELFRLGGLVGKSADKIFHIVAELKNRNLIQQRGPWRAVLPQAIANRLAAMALRRIPRPVIKRHLVDGAPARLFQSFSRRLGYLDSQEAQEIIKAWFAVGGLLEKVDDLNELGSAILINVAPVVPEAVLRAFERILASGDSETAKRCAGYASLLRSIAYDADLFDRCVELIRKIAELQGSDSNDLPRMFASLFTIQLSGTHATIEQRLKIIRELLKSKKDTDRDLGLKALHATLESSHFGPGYAFEFGARSRDYGYWPRTKEEIVAWFTKILDVVEAFVCAAEPLASQVRHVLAEQFRSLWHIPGVYGQLERICALIVEKHFWVEGWIAVRQTIHYDLKALPADGSARLKSLERLLRPKTLVQEVRSIVLSESLISLGIDSDNETDDVEKTIIEVETKARDLGKAVATDPAALAELQSELVTGTSQQVWIFGVGLAMGASEPVAIWNQLAGELSTSRDDRTNPNVLRGFLNGLRERNPELTNTLLDEAVEHEGLAKWYPTLETGCAVSKKGVDRLIRSLKLGKAWIGTYHSLVSGGVSHQISGEDFNRLLLEIAEKPDGLAISMEILNMRLRFGMDRSQSSNLQIAEIGCELIGRITFAKERKRNFDYTLSVIAKACLVGNRGTATIRKVCGNLKTAIAKSETYPFYQRDLLQTLLSIQPLMVLEGLCSEDGIGDPALGIRILEQASQSDAHPFDAISEPDLLKWCEQSPETRYADVARGITAFRKSNTGQYEWTERARKVLSQAPNRKQVLKAFSRQFSPAIYQSSLAGIVYSNAELLDELTALNDPDLNEYIGEFKVRIAESSKMNREEGWFVPPRHTDQGFE